MRTYKRKTLADKQARARVTLARAQRLEQTFMLEIAALQRQITRLRARRRNAGDAIRRAETLLNLKEGEIMPLTRDRRVESISDERAHGEGVWFYLKQGFCNGDLGSHQIHEDTPKGARAKIKYVRVCTCDECTTEATGR